jgi:hypothetical protein
MEFMPVCLDCRHFREVREDQPLTCDAFPDGIPDIVIKGGHEHRTPLPGDHGIRFEPIEDDDDDR